MPRILQALLLVAICFYPAAADGQMVDLFQANHPKLVSQSGAKINNPNRLYDQSESTVIQFKLGPIPTDLVFSFDDQTVAISRLGVKTTGLLKDTVNVEILVSSLSDTEGYRSLQSSPLRSSGNTATSINFVESGAKWVMLRLTPLKPGAEIKVAELQLMGRVGEPKTIYEFDESPAEAIAVLSKLSESVTIEVSPSEKKMFEDAKDGKFDEISFAEASLLSCGIQRPELRQQYLERINSLLQKATQRTSQSTSAFDKGKILLELLHHEAFRNGYREQQTDVSKILDNQTYNCVSSATLYNILARKLGLDARGIEVPDHAFSILYDGTQHVDIETTTPVGFNPARNKAALDQFQRQTGFAYIPDRNRSRRREIGEPGLVAITYYNHGVTHSKEKRYNEALIYYFKVLSLDPKNKSAVKNILGVLANWSAQLAEEKNYEQAIKVLAVGLELAPNDWKLKSNNFAIWQKYVLQQVENDNGPGVLERLKTHTAKSNQNDLLKLQSSVFLSPASKLAKAKNWSKAIAFAKEGVPQVDQVAQKEITKWITNTILRWSGELIDKSEFASAADVLADGLNSPNVSSKWRIENQLAFVVQEWAKKERKNRGEEAGRALLNQLTERFPTLRKIQSVSNNFTFKKVQALIKEKDFEGALKMIADARKQKPKDYDLKRTESAIWVAMAKPSLVARDWPKAIEIYQRAHQARPDEHVFKQNLTYIVQEWSLEIVEKDGITAAERFVGEWAEKLPGVYDIKRMKGTHVGNELRKLVKAADFTAAVALLDENRNAFSGRFDLEKWATHIYFQQTDGFVNQKDWEKAIAIYEEGVKKFPTCSKLKRNLTAVWNKWAMEFMDKEDWKGALEILEKAESSVPGQHTISNNIRYCKSKLK